MCLGYSTRAKGFCFLNYNPDCRDESRERRMFTQVQVSQLYAYFTGKILSKSLDDGKVIRILYFDLKIFHNAFIYQSVNFMEEHICGVALSVKPPLTLSTRLPPQRRYVWFAILLKCRRYGGTQIKSYYSIFLKYFFVVLFNIILTKSYQYN